MKTPITQTYFTKKLGKIYQDIIAIKITDSDTHTTATKKFYAIMRKYGICQGTWASNGNGRIINTPEWTMCWLAWKAHYEQKVTLIELLSQPPDDLLAYGKKPKINKK